jgi:putative effector of murein hydrolase LrgA (UPF0299 family)
MIESFTFLLLCQLAGEISTRALKLSLPGPVAGMALLFAILCWRGRKNRKNGATPALPPDLENVTDSILRHLSLLFVPAAVGIVQYYSLIEDYALAIIAAVCVSTVLTFTVTALLFQAVSRLQRKPRSLTAKES